ncbi:MAG: hypothetical protein ACK52X_06725 [bacterium]
MIFGITSFRLSGDDPLRIGLTQSPDFASQNWLFYYALHQKQAFERAQKKAPTCRRGFVTALGFKPKTF